jgi:hypothetical protein
MAEQMTAPLADADAGTLPIVDTNPKATAPDAAPDAGAAPKADAGDTLKTIADDPADKPVATPATWPEDWREQLAGEDKAFLAVLKRYTSPANYAKAGFEAQQKIRSGEFKKPLSKDATPEQLAEWRKEQGIPEKPDGYEFDLGGFVPGENDKPILDNFKEFAHANNMAPAQLNEIAKWYFDQQEQVVAQQIEADRAYRATAEEELRQEYGPEFRSNINAVRNFLSQTAGEELTGLLFGARLADGTLLGNNAHALRWLVGVAREQVPGAGLVPAGTPDVGKSVQGRIGELEAMMQSEPDKYYRQGFDQELLRLYDAQEKMKGRAA